MAHKKTESVPSRFQPGDKVRVKHGVRDPDFPDIPLGGWAGMIKEVEQGEGETTLLVAWDRATIRGMHLIDKKRCERDGLELESMWLGEEDLEPDDGTPVATEQPTTIVTKPLSEKDQGDRVRMALGLTHDDPLPEVSRKHLLAYHRYLAARLKFPFKAKAARDSMPLTIQRPLDPKDCDPDDLGLLCEARSRGAVRYPAVGSRGRRGEPQAGRGLLLLVPQLAMSRKMDTMARKKPNPESPFLGRWQIVSMSTGDESYFNEEVQAYIEFKEERLGEFQLGYAWGELDYREGQRDGEPAVEWSWEGSDGADGRPLSGRGWAVLRGDESHGMIFIHLGDESEFEAERAGRTRRPTRK